MPIIFHATKLPSKPSSSTTANVYPFFSNGQTTAIIDTHKPTNTQCNCNCNTSVPNKNVNQTINEVQCNIKNINDEIRKLKIKDLDLCSGIQDTKLISNDADIHLTTKINTLNDHISYLNQQLIEMQAKLDAKDSGLSTEEIEKINNKINEVSKKHEDDIKELQEQLKSPAAPEPTPDPTPETPDEIVEDFDDNNDDEKTEESIEDDTWGEVGDGDNSTGVVIVEDYTDITKDEPETETTIVDIEDIEEY